MTQALSCQAGFELFLSHSSWLVMTASSFLQGLTLLLSLTAGKRDRPASKRAAGTSLQASDRLAADKGASSTKPVLSNEGSEKPSQQPQQQPCASQGLGASTAARINWRAQSSLQIRPQCRAQATQQAARRGRPNVREVSSRLCAILQAAGAVAQGQLP